MTKQEKFESLQAKWRKIASAVSDLRFELKYKYGDTWQAPQAKQRKYDALQARESKASDAIFSWLNANSPRDWRHGCPAYWICDELTYADAITTGPLSVVPPLCYGATPSDMLRFAAPLAA